jgi:hypothetical protein
MSALRLLAVLVLVATASAACRTVERFVNPTPTAETCLSIGEQADGPPLTLAFMRDGPWDAVVANVTTDGEGRYNSPDGSVPTNRGGAGDPVGPPIVTRYGVDGAVILRGGDVAPVAVAIRGGSVGCSHMEAHPRPAIREGGRYLFWLRTGLFADGTEDPGLPQVVDAWPAGRDGLIGTPHDGLVTIAELRQQLAAGDDP